MTSAAPVVVPDSLEVALERCADALLETAVRRGDGVTWPTWTLSSDGSAELVRCAQPDLYSGDAGIAYALDRLAEPLARPDLAQCAAAARRAIGRTPPTAPGWITGTRGVADGPWPSPARIAATDLTHGVAAALLAAARAGGRVEWCRSLVEELRSRAVSTGWGLAWPDPTESGNAARPLCGLAHGASGIVLALVEAAYAHPTLADEALSLADAGLRWESTWFDPIKGGWPDLREGITWPVLWCHGAAGGGLVRLRLLDLARAGLDTPWPEDTIAAEAEVAVQACGAAVEEAAAHAQEGVVGHGGLTLCHGLGGPLLVLAEAARVFDVSAHLRCARGAASAVVAVLPEDPADWPSGYRGADGDLGLMTGVAGTALVLATLTRPDVIGGVGLLR